MTTLDLSYLFHDWVTFSLALCVAVLILYLARSYAHHAINGVFRLLSTTFRLAASASESTRKQLRARNREVLLEQGYEQVSRDLEREFFEISRFVQRDLGGYPQLQRQIQEEITQIHDDYHKSGQVPSSLPEWIDAVDSVAKIKASDKGSALNSKILEQIHQSAEQQHRENLTHARADAAERHKLLKSMTGYWRKLADSVDEVGDRLKEIVTRSQNIDKHMNKFNEIHQGTDSALRSLRASSITQFLIAAIVVAIAIGGAYFNFHLIALPMSEMVGSTQRIGSVKVADLAALVIICLEITAGIFLLESLRITKLFPLIGAMDDRVRRIIMLASAIVLVVLAATESALAFMRDQIAGDLENLRASLAGIDAGLVAGSGLNEWIPLAANMTLGFILPLALTMIAIPLEYLLQTGRTVVGGVIEMLLSALTLILRLVANSLRHLSRLCVSLYDFTIAAPLWIEAQVIKYRARKAFGEGDTDHAATYAATGSVQLAPRHLKGAAK